MMDFLKENIYLILTMAAFVFGIVRGYKLGLVKLLLTFLSMVMSLIGAAYVTPILSDLFWQRSGVSDYFNTWSEKILEVLRGAVGSTALPLFDVLQLDILAADAAGQLAAFLIRQLIFLFSFMILLVLFRFLAGLVGDGINAIPLIGFANRITGAAAGFGEVLIYVWLVMAALSLFSKEDWCIRIMESIRGSSLLSTIYSNNMVLRFLARLIH